MFAFAKTSVSLTAKRQSYEEELMSELVQRIAQDLIDQNTTRDVGPVVLARIIKARNIGVKAEEVDAAVDKAIDAALKELGATEGQEERQAGEVTSEGSAPVEAPGSDPVAEGSTEGATDVEGEDNLVEETPAKGRGKKAA